MKENKFQIIVAYFYHAFFILMCFMLLQNYVDALLTISIIADIVYLVYWIILSKKRKSYMPWIVYLHFVIGSAIEVMLNWFGIIPEDSGWFSGLGQLFYILILLIYTILIGIVNLIFWLMGRRIDLKYIIAIVDIIFITLTIFWILFSHNLEDSMSFLVIEALILSVTCVIMIKKKLHK